MANSGDEIATKNVDGSRDPELHQTKKGNQYHFGTKTHLGVDAESGLVHTLMTTAAKAHDVTQTQNLLQGQETEVFADSGLRGIKTSAEAKDLQVDWYIAIMRGKRRELNPETAAAQQSNAAEKFKAGIRAKVEQPFLIIKCEFVFTKVRYCELAKNNFELHTLFARSNLWMVRKHLPQAMPI